LHNKFCANSCNPFPFSKMIFPDSFCILLSLNHICDFQSYSGVKTVGFLVKSNSVPAIIRAVRRWFPTAAARVQSWVRLC
jgi:hypothetical protein